MTGPVACRRSLRCAALLLALAGLFAMHGLGDHGTSTDGTMTHAAMPAMGDHAEHVMPTVATYDGPGLSASPGPLGAMSGGMAGLCLAVLVLALAVVLLVRRGSGRPLLRLASRPAPVPPARGRAPDPPGPYVLSVQRC